MRNIRRVLSRNHNCIDTIKLALEVNTEMVGALEINRARCLRAASDPLLLATDLADYLVLKGVPFREAHELVGTAVAKAAEANTPLDQLDLPAVSEHFGPDAAEVFNLDRALAARTNPGSPAVENVRAEVARWRGVLG